MTTKEGCTNSPTSLLNLRANQRVESSQPWRRSTFPSSFLGSLIVCTAFRCVDFAEVSEDGEARSLVRLPYLHLFFLELENSMPGNPPVSPESSIRTHFGNKSGEESAALFPMLLRLNSTPPVRVRSKITSNSVCADQLGDVHDLVRKHFGNSSPLRGRAAHVDRSKCLCACSLLGRPPQHQPNHQVFQSGISPDWTCPASFLQSISSEGIFVRRMSLSAPWYVELFRSNLCDPMEVRLRFLE